MPARITETKKKEMWKSYQEHGTIERVSKECGVHWNTVKRHCESENWDERLKEIKAEARIKADKEAAERRAKEIGRLDNIVTKMAVKLEKEIDGIVQIWTTQELSQLSKSVETITKLRELLQGEPTDIIKEKKDTEGRRNEILDKLSNIEDAARENPTT